MIKEILSKDNHKIKFAFSLKQKKNREESGYFLCEGIKNLEMALKANCVSTVFTTKKIDFDLKNVEVFKISDSVLDKISSEKNPEGIVFVCKKISWDKNYSKFHKIIYLDEVTDPGNVGTIIRTALALNFDALICSKNCVDLYNEKTISASKGSIFVLPTFIDELDAFKDRDIYVSTLDNESVSLNKVQKSTNFVLVVGNEAHGVSQKTLKLANYKVKIEISDKIDSLNVAIAAGILMNYLR